jgi:hypothetical protein
MKKAILIMLIGAIGLTSCQKEYHCACTFNNTVVYTKDLGTHTKDDATTLCSAYDTTIVGEPWKCTLY